MRLVCVARVCMICMELNGSSPTIIHILPLFHRICRKLRTFHVFGCFHDICIKCTTCLPFLRFFAPLEICMHGEPLFPRFSGRASAGTAKPPRNVGPCGAPPLAPRNRLPMWVLAGRLRWHRVRCFPPCRFRQ